MAFHFIKWITHNNAEQSCYVINSLQSNVQVEIAATVYGQASPV